MKTRTSSLYMFMHKYEAVNRTHKTLHLKLFHVPN